MRTVARYRDRRDAGSILAEEVAPLALPRSCVLALPRGGVPVAVPIALALRAPLDVFLVRKLGVPAHPELAMGAIASGEVTVWNRHVIESARLTSAEIATVAAREAEELRRREADYRRGREALPVEGRHVVLVDDGLATGASMRAAITALRQRQVASVTVAVPVGAADTCSMIAQDVDAFICPLCPEEFLAVGAWYDDFQPITDEEVRAGLASVPAPAEPS